MDIYSFINENDLKEIENKIKRKEKFEFRKSVKGKQDKVSIDFHSQVIDEELANDIWGGETYLVHIDFSHNGKTLGYGGSGYATNEYKEFINGWQHFKEWFDKRMPYLDYDHHPMKENQMSLFS